MKREIYIEVIKDFILEKPSRLMSELQSYAKEVNATEEELKEAINRARGLFRQDEAHSRSSAQVHEKYRKFPSIALPTLPAWALRTTVLFSLSGVLLLSGISVYLFEKVHTISQELNTSHRPSTYTRSSSSGGVFSSLAPPVYANQQVVNAKEIFSYPATDISLRFQGVAKKTIFGFFPYWMIDVADKVHTTGFTDIAIFGLTTDGGGNIITRSKGLADPGWILWNDSRLEPFIQTLKRRKTRVHLTIKSFSNTDIETLVHSNQNQSRFIANAIQLMNSKSLDGINLNFEYVGTAPDKTKQEFVRFMGNLHEEMKRQNPNSTLTIDTFITSGAEPKFFDVAALSPFTDAFVVMGYDIHTPDGSAGPVAPLEGNGGVAGYIQSYLERVPADKIILAVPYYGYDWQENSPGTNSKILPYGIISAISKSIAIRWDETAQTPYYGYTDSETGLKRIVHYENARSLGLKYDFINNRSLAGVGVWAIGYDGQTQDLHQLLMDKFME